MANQGHYGGGGGTRQGLYVMTANGTLLASSNALSADKALETIQQGLEAWKQTEPAARTLPKDFDLPRRRWEASYPQGGLVLRTANTDLGPDADRNRINRDHAWFTAEEARGWLGADPQPGDTHTVSRVIVDRLACFHLVDNVRGQTLPFAPAEVAASKLTTTVVSREGDAVTFEIEGRTEAETDGTWKLGKNDWTPTTKYPRGLTTTVLGSGTFDLAAKRFTAMEMVAVGERTGRTNLNGRPEGDVGPAAIGFVLQLAPDKPSARVPPAFIDVYGAEWVVDPR
ncbi:MAG: hypothetical protein QNJ98_14530 [Planctomycetota bacterium]|nr:hypothetical protein [Planctomycetota bacterium]